MSIIVRILSSTGSALFPLGYGSSHTAVSGLMPSGRSDSPFFRFPWRSRTSFTPLPVLSLPVEAESLAVYLLAALKNLYSLTFFVEVCKKGGTMYWQDVSVSHVSGK